MPPPWNIAVDTLAEDLRWLLSHKGSEVLRARTAYLVYHNLARTDDSEYGDLDADAARAKLVAILSDAEPIFWPKRFCDIVQKSFVTLPLSWRLTDPMLFTTHGFMHFEQPISISPAHPEDSECSGFDTTITAVAWRKERGTLFVDMCAWVIPSYSSITAVFTAEWMGQHVSEQTSRRMNRTIKKWMPLIDSVEPTDAEGVLYRSMIREAAQEASVLRPGGVPWQVTPWRSGQTIQQTYEAITTQTRGSSCVYCDQAYLRLWATALNFLSTRVFVSVPSQTDRAVLRRLARNNARKPQWDAVNVITLRRAERVKHASDEEEVHREWSCHWLVGAANGGFWRNQAVKNDEGQWTHSWRWIMPYVKGNLDKPFKPPGKRVFDVNR